VREAAAVGVRLGDPQADLQAIIDPATENRLPWIGAKPSGWVMTSTFY
jgi:hypothetical protein